MSQRTLFGISGALTAFVLVVAGAIIAFTMKSAAVPSADSAAVSQATAQPDAVAIYDAASVQALLDQHDASYRNALQEANDRIAQANAQLDQAYKDQASLEQALRDAQAAPVTLAPEPLQSSQLEPTATPAPTKAPSYAVSAQAAEALALRAAPGASLMSTPSLVNYQGTVAYEVLLDAGPVYIDANTGKVLYNGASAPVYSSRQAPSGEAEDGEHDQGGDD